MYQILRRVRKTDDRAAVKRLASLNARRGEHVREDGRLGSKELAVDAEDSVTCYQYKVSVF